MAPGPKPFRFVNGPEPETLDPGLMTDVYGIRIADALFEGLLRRKVDTLTLEPGIAERWELSPDARTLTFHLRASCWSDGSPLTADDFRRSWLRVLTPVTGAKNAAMLFPVRNARAWFEGRVSNDGDVGLRVPDARTLIVELEHPTPWFPDLTTFPTLFPVPARVVQRHGPRWTRPGNIVVNGPFLLDDWQLNASFRLRRNPRYWEADRVRQEEIRILTQPLDSADAAFRLYRAGEADWVPRPPTVLFPMLSGRPDARHQPSLATVFLRCRSNAPPFDDPRVRRAFSLALDRADLSRTLYPGGGAVPANHLIPPGFPGYLAPAPPVGDLAEARRLLIEAGYGPDRPFPPVDLFCTKEAVSVGEYLHYAYRERLGVEVRVESREWAALMDLMRRVDYAGMALGRWEADYVEPSTFLDIFRSGSGNNRTGWSSAEYDALLDSAAACANESERLETYRKAEALLLREAPCIPLCVPVTLGLVAPDVHGLTLNPLGRVAFRTIRRE